MDYHLDEMDHQIIEELRHDGRQANTEIARKLSVSETMVRQRIRRLVADGIIQVAARVNLSRLGKDTGVLVGVVCDGGGRADVNEVTRQLMAIPEVRFVSCVSGRYDLLISASFHSRQELLTFLWDRLRKIPGVTRTESFHLLSVAKSDYDYWEESGPPSE